MWRNDDVTIGVPLSSISKSEIKSRYSEYQTLSIERLRMIASKFYFFLYYLRNWMLLVVYMMVLLDYWPDSLLGWALLRLDW